MVSFALSRGRKLTTRQIQSCFSHVRLESGNGILWKLRCCNYPLPVVFHWRSDGLFSAFSRKFSTCSLNIKQDSNSFLRCFSKKPPCIASNQLWSENCSDIYYFEAFQSRKNYLLLGFRVNIYFVTSWSSPVFPVQPLETLWLENWYL